MIYFNCAGCGKPFQSRDDFAGRQVLCGDCGAICDIPLPDSCPVCQASQERKLPDETAVDIRCVKCGELLRAGPAEQEDPAQKRELAQRTQLLRELLGRTRTDLSERLRKEKDEQDRMTRARLDERLRSRQEVCEKERRLLIKDLGHPVDAEHRHHPEPGQDGATRKERSIVALGKMCEVTIGRNPEKVFSAFYRLKSIHADYVANVLTQERVLAYIRLWDGSGRREMWHLTDDLAAAGADWIPDGSDSVTIGDAWNALNQHVVDIINGCSKDEPETQTTVPPSEQTPT